MDETVEKGKGKREKEKTNGVSTTTLFKFTLV
jgi:hypothetical protein